MDTIPEEGTRVIYEFTGNEMAPPVIHVGTVVSPGGYYGRNNENMVKVDWDDNNYGPVPIDIKHLKLLDQ